MKTIPLLPIPSVLLCGGKSRRMGSNKALLPFGTHATLAAYQYHRLKTLFSHVYLSCKDPSLFGFEADYLRDSSEVFAPALALQTIFRTLKTAEFFCLTVDSPLVKLSSIQTILHQASLPRYQDSTLLARTKEKNHYLIGLYRATLLPKLEHQLSRKDYRLSTLFDDSTPHAWIDFPDEAEFINLNTPEAYQEALTQYALNPLES